MSVRTKFITIVLSCYVVSNVGIINLNKAFFISITDFTFYNRLRERDYNIYCRRTQEAYTKNTAQCYNS